MSGNIHWRVILKVAALTVLMGQDGSRCRFNPPVPGICGSFSYSTPRNPYLPMNRVYPGPGRVTVSFSFKPAACHAPAGSCNKVVFVQAIRFRTPPLVSQQPHDTQRDRMTHGSTIPFYDGWAIDTLEGAVWPYYGMENDGSFKFDAVNPDFYNTTVGSSFSTAVLRDSPVSTEWDSYTIEAISVPVCLDSSSPFHDKILGYYTWSWGVPDNDKADYVNHLHGEATLELWATAFDLAVQEWNNHLDDGRQPLSLTRLDGGP